MHGESHEIASDLSRTAQSAQHAHPGHRFTNHTHLEAAEEHVLNKTSEARGMIAQIDVHRICQATEAAASALQVDAWPVQLEGTSFVAKSCCAAAVLFASEVGRHVYLFDACARHCNLENLVLHVETPLSKSRLRFCGRDDPCLKLPEGVDAAMAHDHLQIPPLAERQAMNAQDPWSTVMHYDLNARGLFPLVMGFRMIEISLDPLRETCMSHLQAFGVIPVQISNLGHKCSVRHACVVCSHVGASPEGCL